MKKIYALVAGLVLAGSVSAQTQIKDGGFEGTFVTGSQVGVASNNVGGTTTNMTSLDWMGILKQAGTPITGAKSCQMTSVDDSTAAVTLYGAGAERKTSGFAQQTFKGSLSSATYANYTFQFKYTYAPVGIDTAFALVQVLDSTKSGQAQILAQGIALMPSAQASAIVKNATFQATGNPGTANRLVFMFGSSFSNFADDVPANLGSTLIVDDVQFTTGNVGIENVVATESKIYPNPTTGILNVEISNANASSISIYNLDGSLVKTEVLNGMKGSINVSTLTSGMYIYRIATDKGEVKATFVKQ
jgi:hypothetical protein